MAGTSSAKRVVFGLATLVTAGLAAAAWLTGEWLLTAVALGIAFGFAMQQSGFCGSAILSSVVLLEERRGAVGAGIAIFASMAGFAALAGLGLVTANPKPLELLPAVVGGLAFGSGMVLAGGCVSGSLFKAAEGRVPSMLALVGIGVGTNLVGPGVLGPWRQAAVAATREISAGPGLHDTLGLPFSWVGGAVGLAGLAALLALARRKGGGAKPEASLFDRVATRGWSFATAGLVIGVLGWLAYLSSAACGRSYPLGVTHGVMAPFAVLVNAGTAIPWWLALLVLGVLVGSALSAWLRGQLELRSADAATLLVSLGGGVLVGAGALFAGGCFIGNIVSGWALLSIHTLIFGLCTIAANWATTILYLRGI